LTIYFEEHRKGLFGPCWFSIYGTKKAFYIFFCILLKKKLMQVWTDFSFLNELHTQNAVVSSLFIQIASSKGSILLALGFKSCTGETTNKFWCFLSE